MNSRPAAAFRRRRSFGRARGGCITYNPHVSAADVVLRCQRCGTRMDLRDPEPGSPWKPDQFWVCPRCGRHFWTTYPSPPGAADGPTPVTTAHKASGQ